MTRKFLFCFPLRLGNIVFGYIVIIISLAVAAFHLYQLGLSILSKDEPNEEKFRNFENLESIFGEDKKDLVTTIIMIYNLTTPDTLPLQRQVSNGSNKDRKYLQPSWRSAL
ncbi:unnamed protein product [Leptidea sinapis]|uniref:Uncharacterized protein n=1 Tax=Leptidea sinapis TaxID=189913 RepID=A0A5E4R3D4_9NEOP|nr:unnamed protein product [Leptidea sinapis]